MSSTQKGQPAKTKPGVKPEKPTYSMPKVYKGMAVMWHDQIGAPPTAMALVADVGNDTLSLAVLGPGYHNFIVREGVRHIDHPDKELIRAAEVGLWSYTDHDLEIADELASLREAVDLLMATKPEPK